MRIGVGTWSYHRLVASGAMTELDLVAKTKELGFDAIEFTGLNLPQGKWPCPLHPSSYAALLNLPLKPVPQGLPRPRAAARGTRKTKPLASHRAAKAAAVQAVGC